MGKTNTTTTGRTNKNLYDAVPVSRNRGILRVNNSDIPNSVSYRKRVASRVIARKLGVTSEFVYNNTNFTIREDKNGNRFYEFPVTAL